LHLPFKVSTRSTNLTSVRPTDHPLPVAAAEQPARATSSAQAAGGFARGPMQRKCKAAIVVASQEQRRAPGLAERNMAAAALPATLAPLAAVAVTLGPPHASLFEQVLLTLSGHEGA